MNENNQWICKQKLQEHINSIYCLILNTNEDIIIPSSGDNSIKFCMNQKEWICSQTITAHTGSVYGLSMNDTQNRVISCGLDQLIFTHNKIKNGIQYKRQMLIVLLQNMFYNDKIFTFQPISKEQMQVYKMGIIYKQFSKVKGFIVRSGSTSDCYLFPSQYIKQKCMVVNKKGYNVNLIRKQENEDFIIEQSIDFETFNLFGSISEDGEYLVTWDDKQKEIQIRKYQEK